MSISSINGSAMPVYGQLTTNSTGQTSTGQASASQGAVASTATDPLAAFLALQAQYQMTGIDQDAALGDPDQDAGGLLAQLLAQAQQGAASAPANSQPVATGPGAIVNLTA